jgi:hypothetical protein
MASLSISSLRQLPSLYRNWWSELTLAQRSLPATLVALYWLALLALHGLKEDHIAIGAVILALSYGGRIARVVLAFMLPVFLTAIVYDGKRFIADSIRGAIHVAEPHSFDLRFFGVTTAAGRLTLPEWFQLHTHPALDFVSGIFYLFFIAFFVLFSAYFYFWATRKGTPKFSAARMKELSPRMMWTFFWVNVMGYCTYFIYPAAPPWYAAKYGLGPAILGTHPDPAGAIRFDHLLNVHVFENMYAKGADVFGAVPSLHCAYPMIAAYFCFRFGKLRPLAILYWIGMVFSAMYLNHHYVFDILCGTIYALIGSFCVERVFDWRARRLSGTQIPDAAGS